MQYCRACEMKTIFIWKECSVCLLKSMGDDPLARDVLERKIMEETANLQLTLHPEIGEDDDVVA